LDDTSNISEKNMTTIRVYGADWCGDTRRTRRHLDRLAVPYQYLNVDDDPQAKEFVEAHNDGVQKLPTVDVGGVVLSIPDNAELDAALRDSGSI
jgi:glutaredoxin